MKRNWVAVIIVVIAMLGIYYQLANHYNWWPLPKADDFSRLFKAEAAKPNPLKWVDGAVSFVNDPTLTEKGAKILMADVEKFSEKYQETLKGDKEARAKLIYVGVRCAVIQGEWESISRFVAYGLRAGLDITTSYWPAVALYNAELSVRRGHTESAIFAFEGLRLFELVVVAPDTAIKQTVGQAAKRRYRQLTFGQQVIWVVDSQPGRKGHDVKIAQDIQGKLGVATEGRGKWKEPFLKPYVYYRINGNDIPLAEVAAALKAVGVEDAVSEHQARSKSTTVRRLFRENEKLCFLVILN
ncbi:hypothetical protein GYA13_03165 [Candidatus Kuenenbacteria bacterium]|nr:hypothetical protein [Candidatus Kuenenbacteria bacterium]